MRRALSMGHSRLALGLMAAGCVAAVVGACSDDEHSSAGTMTSAGEGGRTDGGRDGDPGAGDGPAAGGGSDEMGGAAQAGAGTALGGGPSGDAGSGPVGPQCSPRDELPDPIPRTVAVQQSCSGPAACGGDVANTSWEVESACFELDSLFPSLLGVCSAVTSFTVVGSSPHGTATFGADSAGLALQTDVSVFVDFPNACHFCACANLEASLQSAGIDADCPPTCNGGTCTCVLDKTVSLALTGEYATNGEDLEIDTSTLPYCVSDDSLTLVSGSAVYTLRPPAALHTPEICDGLDNDGSGMADDDLAECAGCSSVGACAAGVNATCNGRSGWGCEYTSPDYEPNETRCDAIDNDCDGVLNDQLDCPEYCDGKDNDGIGGIDDDPMWPPHCTQIGVCAIGNDADCPGAAGWRCLAESPAFEVAETECDNLDNDCNGITDDRCCAAGSAKMYYAYINSGITNSYVARANLDGSNIENVVTVPAATLLDVAIDPIGDKIYWANLQAGAIMRADLNGANIDVALAAPSQPRLALDVAHRYIFWSNGSQALRSNLDDLSQTQTLTGVPPPRTLTVDSQHGWLFTGGGDLVHRCNLDGSDLISIGPDLANIGNVVEGIAVDPIGNRLYWTASGGIYRANLDLTGPERILQLSYPHHLFIDAVARRFYWSETVSDDIAFMDIGTTTPTYISPTLAEVRFGQVWPCPP